MKQTAVRMSTYTADVSGVCSALYELGGMVVIHDPSGCNSTYNTHDEPRWYHMDSLIYISGLKEMDALMGNEEKFIRDIEEAARDLKPRFIALVRTPVPYMTGMDFEAAAMRIEEETGIPAFYVPTNGMHSYVYGAGNALALVTGLLVQDFPEEASRTDASNTGGTNPLRINLLGVTPLDFSVGSSLSSLKAFLSDRGFEMISCLAMGSSAEEIAEAGKADVNLVVSSVGLKAAKVLQRRFGTPYIIGLPCSFGGEKSRFAENLASQLQKTAECGFSVNLCSGNCDVNHSEKKAYIIGEAVTSYSIAAAFAEKYGFLPRVICPLDSPEELMADEILFLHSEEDIVKQIEEADMVIADPMYRALAPAGADFIDLPHEAYSGRIYRNRIPDLMHLPDWGTEHDL